MFYALIVLYVLRYAAKCNELKIVFTADRNVLQSHPPQHIQYHTARIQRHHHHKEHTEVKKQSILSYLLIIV